MRCKICGRDNLTERELFIHIKFCHKHLPFYANTQQPQKVAAGVCPDCGTTLWFEEGCVNCRSCGFSKCG